MPNTLNNLARDIYKAADIVGRELVGFIPSVTLNTGVDAVAKGQNVRSHFTRPVSIIDTAPAMTIPEGADQTVDNKTMTMTRDKGVPIPWTGEEMMYANGGSGFETIYGDQIAQAMRAITNQIEADLALEAKNNASRAVGTAGTNPFATNFDSLADVRKVLEDNGMAINNDVSVIFNTTAGAALRKIATLYRANEAGTDQMLRQGTLLDLHGMMLRQSAQVQAHTKGAGASYVTSGSTAIGVSSVALATGTGTVLAGDVVTFAADSANKYVVNTGVAAPGTIVLGTPGAQVIIPTANALTIGNNYTGNIAVKRGALELAIRPPAVPMGGDAAVDRMIVQDPFSGLTFDVSLYVGFKKAMIYVGAVWGYKTWKPDGVVTLLG